MLSCMRVIDQKVSLNKAVVEVHVIIKIFPIEFPPK